MERSACLRHSPDQRDSPDRRRLIPRCLKTALPEAKTGECNEEDWNRGRCGLAFAVFAKVGLEGIMPRCPDLILIFAAPWHVARADQVGERVSVPPLTKNVKDGAPQGF
jgi:hypothetical protein